MDVQDLYGEDFHSASYLLKIRHFNAAWRRRRSSLSPQARALGIS